MPNGFSSTGTHNFLSVEACSRSTGNPRTNRPWTPGSPVLELLGLLEPKCSPSSRSSARLYIAMTRVRLALDLSLPPVPHSRSALSRTTLACGLRPHAYQGAADLAPHRRTGSGSGNHLHGSLPPLHMSSGENASAREGTMRARSARRAPLHRSFLRHDGLTNRSPRRTPRPSSSLPSSS